MQNHDHTTQNKPKPKIPQAPQSSSFLTTVLGVIHFLQGMECYHIGVPSGTIECFMRKYYPVDGDLKSQITCAINQALHFGFIQERKNYRYTLVNAVANIYFAKREDAKQQELSYARHLFQTIWRQCPILPPECLEGSAPKSSRKRRKSSCPPSCPSLICASSDSGSSRCKSRQKKKRVKKSCSKNRRKKGRPCRKRARRSKSSSCRSKCSTRQNFSGGRKSSYERSRGISEEGNCSCRESLRRY